MWDADTWDAKCEEYAERCFADYVSGDFEDNYDFDDDPDDDDEYGPVPLKTRRRIQKKRLEYRRCGTTTVHFEQPTREEANAIV